MDYQAVRCRCPESPSRGGVSGDGRAEGIPARRLGSPLESAAVIAFLASNEASYIVGETIYVDSGVTSQLSPPPYQIWATHAYRPRHHTVARPQ